MDIDYLELDEDLEFDDIKAKINDGIDDQYVNVAIKSIDKYISYRLLEELEDISRVITKESNPVNIMRTLDTRILVHLNRIKPNELNGY